MTVNALTTSSLKDLLAFPFRGKDWQNRLLIGMGIMLLGFVPFLPWMLIMGYFGRIMHRTIRGEELELPEWDEWGKLLIDGLRLLGINWIYLLPGYIVMFGGMAAYFGGFFVLMPIMGTQSSDAAAVMSMLMFALMGIMFLSMFLSYILLFLGGVPLPVAMARVVEQEKFAPGFQLGEIHRLLWNNKGSYFTAWVILAGLMAIFYSITMIFSMTMIFFWAIFILAVPFGFYLLSITAALFGQAYRESLSLTPEAQ
jgi:hypothetical protein